MILDPKTRPALLALADGTVFRGRAVGADGVSAEWVNAGSYTVEQADRVYTARASLTPMYDPKGERMRA